MSARDMREAFDAWWNTTADTLGLCGLEGRDEPLARAYAFAAWSAARALPPAPAASAPAAPAHDAVRELTEAWTQNSCGDNACEEHRLAAALYVLRGNKTHREAAQLVLGADDYPDHAIAAERAQRDAGKGGDRA